MTTYRIRPVVSGGKPQWLVESLESQGVWRYEATLQSKRQLKRAVAHLAQQVIRVESETGDS
jgi:hypothetical protein